MTDAQNNPWPLVFLVSVLVYSWGVVSLGMSIGSQQATRAEHAKAIEADAAHYDSKTGEFVYECKGGQ